MTSSELPLGRAVDYPRHYDPGLLFPIPRAVGRSALSIAGDTLPFVGHDRWHAYELSWLDGRGKPMVATATFTVPADSPHLVESKSLKLYLNSFNSSRFDSADDVRARIASDLARSAGAPVDVHFGLPPMIGDEDDVVDLDALAIDIDDYGPPNAGHLACDAGDIVEARVRSALLKSNCPVTGQPDWAEVRIEYRGPRIDAAGLLRYLVSFRDHAEFHEQCVERIHTDLVARCAPEQLSVEALYTRRGGLDINPWRATPGSAPPLAVRALRQ
ncbi:7-cyano-7-deazaguanine reductase [Lysobacter dokdonensis DS-58]|uniref:NADPH-dependent 7-cyano-7-deazaguanine reductase n=1 Tax=Lysobacter dokdonensis DS-58 TaxID=1300345 RepID=A0A0A2WDU9_9GAMM|nr:NADPH-dependent 7-cyano-7-deazaguanine reductase QueF [Lysobacter dokdonensis]KGQ18386.1 7-cyano-7-deazaguanine reductase [Lysobacter dokdonensis DS-58]